MTRTIRSVLVLFAAVFALGANAREMQDPAKFVEERAQAILAALDGSREAIRADGKAAEAIVERELLPYIDVDYISRLVLGQHWRTASEEQRKRFQAAFQNFLLKSYGQGLADFTEDRLKVMPLRGEPDPRRTIVQTQIARESGQPVPVAFTMRWTDDGWKLFDVIIEGISYVRNYRTDFNSEVQQRGLDALIERLEKGQGPEAPGMEKDAS